MSEKILIADRNQKFLDRTEEILRSAGYRTLTAADYDEGKARLAKSSVGLVLCAASLPPGSGHDLVRLVKKKDPTVPCVLLFGEDGTEPRASSVQAGADNYLVRPLKRTELLSCVRAMEEIRRLKQELNRAPPAGTRPPGEGIFDPLTGFYTFAHFKQLLFLEVKRAKRHSLPLAVAMIGYDPMPASDGVPADQLATQLFGGLSVAIRRSLRDIDIPVAYTRNDVLVMMPHTGLEGARVVAERIEEKIRQSILRIGRAEVRPTVSIGLAAVPELRSQSFSDLIKTAHDHQRRASVAGGGRVQA